MSDHINSRNHQHQLHLRDLPLLYLQASTQAGWITFSVCPQALLYRPICQTPQAALEDLAEDLKALYPPLLTEGLRPDQLLPTGDRGVSGETHWARSTMC